MPSLANLLQLVIWAGSALLVLGLLVIVARHRPPAYLVLVVVTYVASQWRQSVSEVGAVSLRVSLGSVYVGLLDLLVIAAAAAAGIAVLQGAGPRWNSVDRAIAGLSVLTALGVLHWILSLGLEPGVNDWRSFIYAMCLYWWARVLLRAPLEQLLIGLGVFTAAVQAYGYATTGFAYGAVLVNGQYFDARPVHAQSALIMVIGLMAVMSSRSLGLGLRLILGVTLGASALISLHRSVWVSLLAALLVWALQRDAAAPSRATRAIRIVPLGFVAVAVVALGSLSANLSRASQNDQTFLWRMDLWLERLSRQRSAIEWLFGGVAVPDNQRDLGSFVGTSHSMYVDVLEMFGLIGLLLLALAMFRVVRISAGSSGWSHPAIAAVFAFGLFYPWSSWVWILLGCLAASDSGPRARRGERNSSADGIAYGGMHPRTPGRRSPLADAMA